MNKTDQIANINENVSSIKMPLISIIIPIYNTETYLQSCIDSVLSQSFTDYEVLLINDGSTDNSGLICDQYALKDARIEVFHTNNNGPSAARNLGLNEAKGQYIAMIDSDDVLLSKDYLQIMYNTAVNEHSEVIICGHVRFSQNEPIPKPYGENKVMGVVDGLTFNRQLNAPMKYIHNCSHGKLFRKELFNNIRYPEGRIFEDVSIIHRLTFSCKRIIYIGMYMYGFRRRPESLENSASDDALRQAAILAIIDRMDFFNSKGYPNMAKKEEQSLLRWLTKHKKKQEIEE